MSFLTDIAKPFSKGIFILHFDQHLQSSKTPGPEAIKLFPCSPQVRIKFKLLINVNILTMIYEQDKLLAFEL